MHKRFHAPMGALADALEGRDADAFAGAIAALDAALAEDIHAHGTMPTLAAWVEANAGRMVARVEVTLSQTTRDWVRPAYVPGAFALEPTDTGWNLGTNRRHTWVRGERDWGWQEISITPYGVVAHHDTPGQDHFVVMYPA